MKKENEWVIAEAPSNIALIKYMGKVADPTANRSANSSLSWTLSHLRTRVRVRFESESPTNSRWRPLVMKGWHAPQLSEAGQERYLRHADRCLALIRTTMESKGIQPNTECRGRLVVESANGFPSDCGLASSASSFAALTIAIAKLLGLTSEYLDTEENLFWLASLSREGSGSSCRSFFQPWAIWGPDGAKGVPGLPRAESIQHIALIVDDQKKLVSSSEAHVRVATSELFVGRIARAESRLRELLELLSEHGGNPSVAAWNRACEISWIEFWDMHVLFETSRPPFGYFSSPTMLVLEWLRNYQIQVGPSRRHPMVTMDAGPNIHLLIWKDEALQDDLLHDLKKFLNASGAATVIDSEGFR